LTGLEPVNNNIFCTDTPLGKLWGTGKVEKYWQQTEGQLRSSVILRRTRPNATYIIPRAQSLKIEEA